MSGPRIGKLVRDGRPVYYSHVDGKYFEHPTRRQVRAHLKCARELAQKYKDMEADAEHKYLQQYIFAGLPDLNTGIDSPLIPHFSPTVFGIVLDRCAAHNVNVTGIEMFDITKFPTEFIGMRDAEHLRSLVTIYRNVPGITFTGFYDARSKLSDKDRMELENRDAEFSEALGFGEKPDTH